MTDWKISDRAPLYALVIITAPILIPLLIWMFS